MTTTGDELDTRIGATISVKVAAPPLADAIFLPTDGAGTVGRLNGEILDQLGLPKRLPKASDLKKGYHIERWAKGYLCYVVTIADAPAPDALRSHLSRALSDPLLASVRSMWLPLMGTGTGRISVDQSFAIIFDVLQSNPAMATGNVTAVISLPPRTVLNIDTKLKEAISQASGLAAPLKHVSVGANAYGLPRSSVVGGILEHAINLAQLHEKRLKRLSPALLFFALAESQAPLAPEVLQGDLASEIFSSAVHLLAANRFASIWASFFGKMNGPLFPRLPHISLKPTANAVELLLHAHVLAGGEDNEIQLDDLIVALLGSGDVELLQILEEMAVSPGTAYRVSGCKAWPGSHQVQQRCCDW